MLSSVLSAMRQENESRTAKVLRGYSELWMSWIALPVGPEAVRRGPSVLDMNEAVKIMIMQDKAIDRLDLTLYTTIIFHFENVDRFFDFFPLYLTQDTTIYYGTV